jgi:alpha-ketoglutarate-dependent taurine dioxygenase
MPDAIATSIRCRLLQPGKTLPLLVELRDHVLTDPAKLRDILKQHQGWFELQLHTCGAILLRGFGVECDDDFEKVSRALTNALKRYIEGNSPRDHTSDFVYTSTSYPSTQNISLHNELSYAHSPPRRLFFNCQTAPEQGGEAPIVDCRQPLSLLDPEVIRRFDKHGVRYLQTLHDGSGLLGRSWQETFRKLPLFGDR